MHHREVNCRTSNLLINYVRLYHPDALDTLLQGFDEKFLTHEYNWTSYQTINLLFQRLVTIAGRADIPFEVGRQSLVLHALGMVHFLMRLIPTGQRGLEFTPHFTRFFAGMSRLAIFSIRRGHVRLEHRLRPGYRCTPHVCHYIRGLFHGLLDNKQARRIRIREIRCAVPVWEKHPSGPHRFFLRRGRLWREVIATGRAEDLGPASAHRTYDYQGVVYGAESCLYDLQWRETANVWVRLTNFISQRSRLLDDIRTELVHAYDAFERQNQQLQASNQLLEELLTERTQASRSLETKVAERTAALQDTVLRLQELDQMKTYFLSITSHELRTPLTIIKGAVNLLQTEYDQLGPERVKKYLHMAEKNTDRLVKLLNDLLDLTRLEAGHMKLDLEPVELTRLIRERVEEFRFSASQRNQVLSSELPGRDTYLVGDALRVKQMVDNLLSNAVKFTPFGGQITVRLSVTGLRAQIEVCDTGVGIDPAFQESIFQKFQQADSSLTREGGGVGLGLTIVRDLALLHGGDISVHSQLGEGSRFRLALPLGGPEHPERVAIRKPGGDRPPMILGT